MLPNVRKQKSDYVTTLLGKNKTKTRLPVEARIHYKIATLAFKRFENSLPPHLSELRDTYQPSRTLRSSSEKLTLTLLEADPSLSISSNLELSS